MKRLLAAGLVLGLAACAGGPGTKSNAPAPAGKPSAGKPGASQPTSPATSGKSPYAPAQEDLSKRGHYVAGGLYAPHIKDSAPDVEIDVSLIPEPEVVAEERSRYGNRPTYAVLGKNYRVLDDTRDFVERGTASYYGNKFHGRRTSNMEVYDIYAFTAAHKSLPLPSFARVTNLDNGQSVVVRVNDRGPFHEGRVVDLSYAAAVKLGIDRAGTGRVEVRALQPGESVPQMAAVPAASPAVMPSTSPTVMPAAIMASRATPSSSMDSLVATLPVGAGSGAGALKLPPGVRIATGKPTPPVAGATPAVAAAVPGRTNASAALPVAVPGVATSAAPAGSPTPTVAAEAVETWRFDMNREGRAMTADEFDTWMAERKVNVATGRPKPIARVPVVAEVTAAAASSPPAPVTVAQAVSQAPQTAAAPTIGGVVLQVASFTARDNADRALAILRGAGIDGANVFDGTANGRRVWRLRVGPLESAAASGLATRIAGLGFGQPHRVTE
ncbi:MAG: septal ring lytic transglycosylase RlpA family protein [Lysobacter sp.]